MGAIIYWAIIRMAILIPLLWIGYDFLDYSLWFWFGLLSLYGVILHPAMIQYRLFVEENKEIISNTLCSSCQHFDETAVICLMYDKHPSVDHLPCDGIDWEPKPISQTESNEYY